MKKKYGRIIALLLTAALALSLCACGGGGDTQQTDKSNTGETTSDAMVYAASFSPVDNPSEDSSFRPMYIDETGFYCAINEKVGEDIPEGVVPEYEGQYAIYEMRIYKVGFDGKAERLEGYKAYSVEPEQSGTEDNVAPSADGGKNYNSYIQSMCSDGKDGLVVYENCYVNWYDGPEGLTQNDNDYWSYYKYEETGVLRHLNADGSEVTSMEVYSNRYDGGNYDYFYLSNICSDSEGNIYASCEGSNGSFITVYDSDFNEKKRIELDNWVNSMVCLNDGRVAYNTWGEDGYVLTALDPATGSAAESYKLPQNAYSVIIGGGDYDFYYSSGVSFYGYDLEKQEETRLFSWLTLDVDNYNLGELYVAPDGLIYGISNTWNDDYTKVTSELVTVNQVPYDSVAHKETITLAVQYLDYRLRSYLLSFNRNNPSVRIEVVEYSDDDSLEKLRTEIMAGNCPDLIDSNTIALDRLTVKGLLADLYPYIDADKEISREDFFPNILSALETDGKLYSTVSTFSVQTVVGSSKVVGDTPGWTYEDLYAAIGNMPEGCNIFDCYMTRDTIMSYGLNLELNNLIDWNTGKCNFDSNTFKALLEFASRFPATYDWENDVYVDSYEAVAQGKQMLLNAYIYSFEDVMQYPALFNNELTFIGYPTYDGVGSMLSFSTRYAMFESCKNKEAAWEFLRYLMTEEYQNKDYSLPSIISAFDAAMEKAMTPQYQTDANGNFVLDENGDRIEVPKYSMGLGWDSSIEIYSLSQEMADTVRDIVSSCTRVGNYDQELFDLVMEESEAYFAGQKTADEVAKLLQNRINIYVNEQR